MVFFELALNRFGHNPQITIVNTNLIRIMRAKQIMIGLFECKAIFDK